MISYRPLLDYCKNNNLKISNVIIECGLSTNLVTKIKRNKNIELKAIDKICLSLGIPIEQAIVILKSEI